MDEEMKESIYDFDDTTSYKEIQKLLVNFISNICENRRRDAYDGAYKAVVLLLPNKGALKACENNGKCLHEQSIVNLVRYLIGDYSYLEEEDISNPYSYMYESRMVREEGLEVRFSAGLNELLIEISQGKNISEFQLRTLILIIELCKEITVFNKKEFHMKSPKAKIYFPDLNEDSYQQLINYLNGELNNMNQHTIK